VFSRIISTLLTGATEPSLKRLRNRLLAVNLISLTLVVIVAFSLIYIDSFNRTQNEIEKTLDSIPPGVFENVMLSQQIAAAKNYGQRPDDEGITISGGPLIPVDYSKSFVVNIKRDSSITVFSMLDIDKKDYFYAIKTALDNGSSEGALTMAGREWRYCVKQSADLQRTGIYDTYDSSIVFLDVDEVSRNLKDLALSLFIIGIVAVGAILLVSLLVANRAIRPVEESMARQRRFVADASHELKTPIAVISANAEAAKAEVYELESSFSSDDDKTKAGVSRWIDNIADEAIRMDRLVKSLLALAKAEETRIIAAPFDLFDAIREEADHVEAFLFEKNIAFIFESPPAPDEPLLVCSDRVKVRTILSVLIENAVKYTPEGGSVTIAAERVNDPKIPKASASVSVANTGEYIPPEDIARVFDRFFRGDRSRSSETAGHGIGLSIAKETAQALGGDLSAMSVRQSGGGAVNTFTLTL